MGRFVYRRRVQFAETDMAGIVHFSNYYKYMEEAEHAFFRAHGLSIMMPQPDGTVIGWPRVRCSCAYEAPAHFEEEIEIHLRISRKGVKSLTFEFEFFRTGERLAHGQLKTVCCICHPGRLESIEIPPEYSLRLVESPE